MARATLHRRLAKLEQIALSLPKPPSTMAEAVAAHQAGDPEPMSRLMQGLPIATRNQLVVAFKKRLAELASLQNEAQPNA